MKLFVGITLVVISLAIIVATFFPLASAEVKYQIKSTQKQEVSDVQPIYPDFGIIIPKLDINAKVIKDVDPYNAKIYQKALTQGVAHAKGTALPGENGNVFIFSHSSENFYDAVRYNSIFYLLNKLEIGDTVSVYYENNRYDYHVTTKKIINPSDTTYLTTQTDKPQLTLMTCYPPGTNLKRLIIIAN